MSDEESPGTPPAEEAPGSTKKAPKVASAAPRWAHIAAALTLGLALGGTGGYLYARKYAPPVAARPRPTAGAYVPVAAWTPRKGPEHAKVTIVEFSDFQCPHCAKAGPVLQQVVEAYSGDVSVQFRHFPIPSHSQAEPAARAMQAAHRQGKAFEMADKIFGNMARLKGDPFEGWAGELGLDAGKFSQDLASPAIKEEVAADAQAGKDADVRATPTIFINGKRHSAPRTLEGFQPVVEEELKAADELIKADTPLEKVYETRAKANSG